MKNEDILQKLEDDCLTSEMGNRVKALSKVTSAEWVLIGDIARRAAKLLSEDYLNIRLSVGTCHGGIYPSSLKSCLKRLI